jgi:hypothetical protein
MSTVHIAILSFEGSGKLDSLMAPGILNRIKKSGWRVSIADPTPVPAALPTSSEGPAINL